MQTEDMLPDEPVPCKRWGEGLDGEPMAYKDIDTVMKAQGDLVEIIARFDPKIVKMCREKR